LSEPRGRASSALRVVGVLLLLGAGAAYLWLRFSGGVEHPLAKVFGLYHYHLTTLAEYAEYKRDANRFYEEHRAVGVSFNCDMIRDDLVKSVHDKMVSEAMPSMGSPEVAALEVKVHRLGAWAEGNVLHLASPNVTDSAPRAQVFGSFSDWRHQITELATVQHERSEGHFGSLLQALFAKVTIHGAEDGEEFSVVTQRKSKFDACGRPRE
jgi:hypothetical protein